MAEQQKVVKHFSQQAIAEQSRRRRIIAILVVGLCLIVGVIFLASNPFAEWKRSNPPEWAEFTKDNGLSYQINTRLVVPQEHDVVIVVSRLVPRDTEAGRLEKEELISLYKGAQTTAYAYVYVHGFFCGDQNPFRDKYGTLSMLTTDASGHALNSPNSSNEKMDSIEPGTKAMTEREAACWLRSRAKPETRIPSEYRASGQVGPLIQDPYQ